MRAGVTIVDPATTYLEPGIAIGSDAIIVPNTAIGGRLGDRRAGAHRPERAALQRAPGRRRVRHRERRARHRGRRGDERSGRSRTCAAATSSAPACRSATSSRSRTRGWRPARRPVTSPISATRRSVRTRTSAPARSPVISTACTRTRPRSGATLHRIEHLARRAGDRRRRRAHRRRLGRDPRRPGGRPRRRQSGPLDRKKKTGIDTDRKGRPAPLPLVRPLPVVPASQPRWRGR